MAAPKTTGKKKAAQRRTTKSTLAELEQEIPRTLREYQGCVRTYLDRLERDIEHAVPQARRRAAQLIREASHELGRLEERGEAAWQKRAARVTREAQALLRRLERAVAPPSKAAQKKAPRKPTSRKAAGGKRPVSTRKAMASS